MKGDFIGFTFGDVHSSDLGIIRVSNSNRYTHDLLPAIQDKTVQVPGGHGTYYFGSYYTQRQFSVPIAFDQLSESELLRLFEVFGDTTLQRLIFDEAPYKYYMAKSTGTPQIKYICFECETNTDKFLRGENVYRGEGTLSFIAYFPFARSRYKYLEDYTCDNIPEWNDDVFGRDYYTNINEWQKSSGIIARGTNDTFTSSSTYHSISLYNGGQMETDIGITLNLSSDSNGAFSLASTTISLAGETRLVLSSISSPASGDTWIRINSKDRTVAGGSGSGSAEALSGNLYNKYLSSGDFFKIQSGSTTLEISGAELSSIDYDFLYYS